MRMIRADGDIRGFQVGGQQFKVSAYADDVLLSLTDPETSLPALMSQLKEYSQISGYKINVTKSMILPILVPARMLRTLTSEVPLQISASELPYLGIKLTGFPESLYDVNYATMYAMLKQDLECWDKYAISWVGRMNCIKMNVIHVFCTIFKRYWWHLTPRMSARCKEQLIISCGRERGTGWLGPPFIGLNSWAVLVSRASFRTIMLLSSPSWWHGMGGGVNAGRWVELERALMAPNLPHHWIWLAQEHRPLLSTNCPAIMNTIRIWDKLAAKCELATLPSPLTPIFRNREFPAGLIPLPFQQLWDAGLLRLCHLYQKDHFVPSVIFDQQVPGTGGLFLPERQLRAFASRRHIKAASQTPLSFFESICLRGTHPKGLISTLYYKSIMLWGCFASAGTGELQRVQGTMNSLQYQEILDDNVMQSVTNLRLGRRWTFQQDNDPKHTSKSTRAWLQIKGWNILEWPSQSPDLNPIENLWWDLKKAVAVRKPKNVTELEAFAHDEWAKIPVDRCKTLVTSYASRLKAVITVKGCCTVVEMDWKMAAIRSQATILFRILVHLKRTRQVFS
uniref:Reverse transcriptase domain-containing protein n=1 Tax=Leptobrachium leishanense TaxID=445787 RepID=A0A8C5MA01_9ANUR